MLRTGVAVSFVLLLAGLAAVLFALRSRHGARAQARAEAAWQQAYDSSGGARRVFAGYDQAQAERMVRAQRDAWRRRYRRPRTSPRASGDRAAVVPIESKRKAGRS
jgi:hypothetical protein